MAANEVARLSRTGSNHAPPLSMSAVGLDYASAVPGFSRPPEICDINGNKKIPERRVWESFINYQHVAHEADALTYAKTRKEALQHFISVDRHSLLTEIWLIEAERLIFGGRIINAYAKKLASQPNAKILSISTWTITEQQNWIIALDYPHAQVEAYRPQYSWPSYIERSAEHVGPDNYHSTMGKDLVHLPYADNSFDVLSVYMCWFQIRNAESTAKFFTECKRVLKPGGVLEVPSKIAETFIAETPANGAIQNLMDEFRARDFDEQINHYYKMGGFKGENTAAAYVGMPCAFEGEIGYLCQYILLFYRMHIIRLLVSSKRLPEDAVEETIRIAMHLDTGQSRESVVPLWFIGHGRK